MIKEPENIENRVRNSLSTIKTLNDLIGQIVSLDADDENSIKLYDYLIKSNLLEQVKKSIDKLIILSKAADKKIDDPMFNVEDYIVSNNITL